MPKPTVIAFLSDEDVPGAIVRALRQRHPTLDVVRVQEVDLMNTPDSDILEWAAHEGRIIFTRDITSMTAHANDRVSNGMAMSGIIVIPERMPIGQVVRELEIIAFASCADDWRDKVEFLPL